MLVEEMKRRGHDVIEASVVIHWEGSIRQIGRKAWVWAGRVTVRVVCLGQDLVDEALLVCLRDDRARLGETVRAGEEAVKVVEGVVLEIDDDDVIDRQIVG